jgi:hypothetical protein
MPPAARQSQLNTVLSAAATNAAPLLPFNEEDPAHLTHAQFGPLLFDPGGMVPTDFSTVDKSFLHPAIRAIAANPVGRCRSSLARIYNALNQTDYLALADTVVYSAYEILRCGRSGVFLWLGVALDAGGLFPGVDLVGVGFVFVLDGAVEAGWGAVRRATSSPPDELGLKVPATVGTNLSF